MLCYYVKIKTMPHPYDRGDPSIDKCNQQATVALSITDEYEIARFTLRSAELTV